MDKSCAWSTASVIKLSAESAVPCCNSCWWWTPCKQSLPSSSRTHSSLPVLPALPRSAHSAIYADESGRRRGDICKHISWGSDFNRITALASKKPTQNTQGKKTKTNNPAKQTKKPPNWVWFINWSGNFTCAISPAQLQELSQGAGARSCAGTGQVALNSALLEETVRTDLRLEGNQAMGDNMHLRSERSRPCTFPKADNYAKDFFPSREAISTLSSVSFVYFVQYISWHPHIILHRVWRNMGMHSADYGILEIFHGNFAF